MVTTRRSSFGVQEGDTLALRSKSQATMGESTPTKKRKEFTVAEHSSSRKKHKSFGNDDADNAIIEAPATQSTSLEDAGHFDKHASGPVDKQAADLVVSQPEDKKGGVKNSTSWLEEDFVPLSTEDLVRRSDAKIGHDDTNSVEKSRIPTDRSIDGLDKDAGSVNTMNDTNPKDVAHQEIQNASQEPGEVADHKQPTRPPALNVHKRFGSEGPELIEEEAAVSGEQARGAEEGVEGGIEDGGISSDDDAPEVVGSKSLVKDSRPHVKAPKKAKRKAKHDNARSNQTPTVDTEQAAADEDAPGLSLGESEPLTVQTRATSSHQSLKQRGLFHESDKKRKDLVKDGVIYRTLSDPQPAVFASNTRQASHLPPKSNANTWRLKKQILGRKRFQHFWGGRSAFLRG